MTDDNSRSAAAEPDETRIRRSPHYRRGFPTHPFETKGWSGRAAPRSPGQPPTRVNTIPLRISAAELQAQSLACTQLVRACRQAIDDLQMEGADEPAAIARAAEILREIQTDWSTALAALRKLSRR